MIRLIEFEGRKGRWSYQKAEFRPPRKGEYYLSGAVPSAWQAKADLTTPYWGVWPLHEYKQQMVWVRA